MGRYTLKVKIEDLGTFSIKVPEIENINGNLRLAQEQKEKVSLMAIDAFTINKDPSLIIKDLNFDKAVLKGQVKFYISYLSNKQEKKLRTILNGPDELKNVALEGNRNISLDNKYFQNFVNKVFIPKLNNPNFVYFFKKNKLFKFKLDEWVDNYLNGDYDIEYCYKKIVEYASDYKQFRALVMGMELYYQSLDKNKTVTHERPNYEKFNSKDSVEEDPDRFFGLYSEDELRKYREELESLPLELYEADRRHQRK